MKKSDITEKIISNHRKFIEYLENMNDEIFLNSKDGKWTPGQHLKHIIKTLAPVNMAMGLPLFIIAWRVGKANRASRTYDELVARYNEKLTLGGVAPARFVPDSILVKDKKKLIRYLSIILKSLCAKIEKKAENELDEYILPHPLLGKITLREMLYFSAYHVEHHLNLVR